jgi:hypothetical protein
MSLRKLKRQLRGLGNPKFPEQLKAVLMGNIANDNETSVPGIRRLWFGHSRDVAAAVAAVFLIGVMAFAVDHGLSVSSQVSFGEVTDISLSYPRWDLNGFMYDHNTSPGEEGVYLQ